MFSYIFSFFRKSDPESELSLEDCTKILASENYSPEINEEEIEPQIGVDGSYKEEYNFASRKGVITARNTSNSYVIDDLYSFTTDTDTFSIGTVVSYQKLVYDGKIDIYNVAEIQSDWDTNIEKDSFVNTRVLICKVERRDKRILHLSHENMKLDLDKVATVFVPIVGDWIELLVKCEVNDQTIDLSGDVITIDKLSPVRAHIITGQITAWDSLDCTGTINRDIFFNKDSLSCGYVPVVKDKIVAEIIESDQGRCIFRALKIIPESIKNRFDVFKNSDKQCLEESHPGLDISGTKVNFSKLGDSEQLRVVLSNKSSDIFKFIRAELSDNCTQIVLSQNSPESVEIRPEESLEILLNCTAKNISVSNELLTLIFENFIVNKYINLHVNINVKNPGSYQRNNYNNGNNVPQNGQIIRGQRQHQVARFQIRRLPDYAVPKHLLNVYENYYGAQNRMLFTEELKKVKRSVFNNLNHMNYEEKFHTLLHMDEIVQLMHMRRYNQDRVCFIPNGEFLMLEIENLAERRPSIVIGDRIQASDPLGHTNEIYEGNVTKVGAKHVYLKFSELFHQMYNGEDYTIRVIPGRASYKRQHHAVFLISRNLGRNWLFPAKIEEKNAQIEFWYEPYPNIVSTNSSESANKRNVKLLVSLAKEIKIKKELEELNKNVLKLEWYNKTLNCKQKDAVVNILKGTCRPLPYVIFGPPGTGKTVTVIESIMQVLRMLPGSRILVTAPSNSAADLIALRLIDWGVLKPGDLVRLVSVNYALGEQIPPKLVPYCATGSVAKEGTAEENIRAPNGMLLDCSRFVLGRHRITVSTCSSAGVLFMMDFPRGHFTHIFVDEAGQAAESEVMIALSFLDKYNGQAVLAGDPMQLGPVVLCSVASECGLNESYLERLLNRFPYVRDTEGFPESEGFDPRLVTKLLYNYRSMMVILNLFSSQFYNGELIPTISDEDSREAVLLNSLASILPKTRTGKVPSVVFHSVDGENFQTPDSPSWYNPHEAAQVFFYLNELYRLGLKSDNVGIITPYTKQVREIRGLLKEADFDVPKIGTVEDFQGQEFDVILLSTVRSGEEFVSRDLEHSLGFVASPKRLNVAISRPKALLVVVGNPAVLSSDVHWRSVIAYCWERGAYIGSPLLSD